MKTFEEAIAATIEVPTKIAYEDYTRRYMCLAEDISGSTLLRNYIQAILDECPKEGDMGPYLAQAMYGMFHMGMSVGMEMERG